MFLAPPAAPKPPQDAPRRPKTAPRPLQDRLKTAQDGRRPFQDRLKTAQDRSKTAPRTTKKSQEHPKSDPRATKTTPRAAKNDFTSFPRGKIASKRFKKNLSEQEREARYILGPLSDILGALGCLFCKTMTRQHEKMIRWQDEMMIRYLIR